jgi:cell wall assembly regulator SMI1
MPSSAEPPTLTHALLDALLQRWRACGAPIAERLRPGLTRAEIRAMTEPLSLTLPEEALRWWEWHDGTFAAQFSVERALGAFGGLVHLTLAEAIELYGKRMRPQEEWERDTFEEDLVLWDRTWLPIATEDTGRVIVCSCGDPSGVLSPVHALEWGEAASEVADRGTRSFGELVTWWIEALDSGGWHYDAGTRTWTQRADRIDPDRIAACLV